MSNVTIVTPIRDAAGHPLSALIERLTSLDYDNLRFIAVEGDSADDTLQELERWTIKIKNLYIVKRDTGKPRFGHIVSQERFKHLAGIINAGVEAAIADNWADYILAIPSDVHFEPDLVTRLLSHDKHLIAAMFWTEEASGLRFYDTWAFSRAGMSLAPFNFTWYQTHFPAEHSAEYSQGSPVEMDTVGGAILTRADLFRQGLRYSEVNLDRGLCEQVRSMGHSVWCDPNTHIIHL